LLGYPEIAFHSRLCVKCGRCKEVCPDGAIIEGDDERIDREKCTRCMECVKVCGAGALSETGLWMSVGEVLRKVSRYIPFYINSEKGGVTISGGEPLYQVEFTAELIKQCKKSGIHTAVETCGHGDYRDLRMIADNVDLLLYDIKHMDDAQHRAGTGVGNKEILANLTEVCKELGNLEKVIRIPLVPEYNDDEENIRETAEYVRSLRIEQIDLLPFNGLPGEKYRSIGAGIWAYENVKQQSETKLEKLANIVVECGLKVTIGGLW
jgi:pyruvate formate lyase activating enzyme